MNIQAKIEKIRVKFKLRLDSRTDAKGGQNALVYGLCKGEGIDTDGMEPREAWEAYEKKTGKKPEDAYLEADIKTMDTGDLYRARETILRKMQVEKDRTKYGSMLAKYKEYDKEAKDREKAYVSKKSKSEGPTKEAETKKEAKKQTGEAPKASGEKKAQESQADPKGNESPKTPKVSEKPTSPKRQHGVTHSADAYSDARKENALWSKDPQEVDDKVRDVSSRVWNESTKDERKSAVLYTRFSGMFNDKQRKAGEEGDYEAQSEAVKELTNMIDRSSYDFDMKLQRGTTLSGASRFLGVSEDELKNLSGKKLKERLSGLEPIEFGFSSTGAVSGYGTTPKDEADYKVQYRIYAPSGTKMLYCEPFSWYNKENDNPYDWWEYKWWDGKSRQKGGFSREMEMLLQRNTRYRVTGVERDRKGVLWIDMDVISQNEKR